MSVRRLRAVVLPLVVAGLSFYAVASAGSAPQQQVAAPAAAPALPEPLGELWSAWGADLAPGSGAFPARLASLQRDEALYVLLSVRAAQVAEAVDRAGPGTGVDAALREAGLSPQPALVPAEDVPQVPGCVVLTYADDLYGRSYFGWADAPLEPGPDPESPLEELLLRTSRVGLAATDAESCGGGVAYSPAAQAALRELSPVLLG